MEIVDAEYLHAEDEYRDEGDVVRRVLRRLTSFRDPRDEDERIAVVIRIPDPMRDSRGLLRISVRARERIWDSQKLKWVFVKTQLHYDGHVPIRNVALVFRAKTVLEDLVGY